MVPLLLFTYFMVIVKLSKTEFLDEPRIITIDGHLYIYGANYKNVSLMVSPKGYLNVNGENLYKVVEEAKEVSSLLQRTKHMSQMKIEEEFKYVVRNMDQMIQKLNICETFINNIRKNSNNGVLPFQFQMKINKLERRVKTIMRNLSQKECQKDPCMNGGTCFDMYLDYECRCLEGWEGKMCERDVNECGRFAGSDLGCQNGATCINKPGTYECVCAPGWYGLHCTRRSNDCSSGSASELCGHGTCVTQTSGTKGFTCICDQGWKTDGVNPSCNVDVDECERFPCSKNPSVLCHNTPGNFFCGPCPAGYSGNGFSCSDINECLIENGGCSVQPMVQCINTQGSSTCGPCPPGYSGDGRTCTFVGKCNVDNGGCHPNARCQEVGSNVQCQCLPGYTGRGLGPFGCELTGVTDRNVCFPNPCLNGGRCYAISDANFTCSCRLGFTGFTCSRIINPCSSNPCQNGATCMRTPISFYCKCTSLFFGKYCEKEIPGCGGYLISNEGELQFPPANSSSIKYYNNLNCAWIITVDSPMVINVTFEYFDLESASECQRDWFQIHDGKSAGDHIIGKFCGQDLPNNGTIISSTNCMYMWFKSDPIKNGNGFRLTWRAVPPVCGGPVNASIHGTIRSPGSPGKYPPNRDCIWLVTAPLGKRIAFTFFEVFIEAHQNCSYDFLEFHEGLTLDTPLLARYCNTTIPQPLTTPGNTALVYFHSDRYQSDRGFQIAYNSVPGYPGCGGIYTRRRGDITPPMEEGHYMRNLDCAWLIRLSGNLRIKIEFSSFKVENRGGCSTDFVEIREGSDVTAPLIGRFCGFTLPPVIESEGNVLFVRFYSDNTIEYSGFRLTYKSVCNEIHTEESGVIQSPGYPNKYKSQEECIFIVEQPPGKIIHLEFQDFEFESISVCHYDYIEIRDGHSESSPLIKKYCGTDRPPPITSTHNYLWIKLVTDKDVEMRGFYANYTTVDVSCGGIHTAPEGEISSPSEAGSYPSNHNCKWVIAGKPGMIVQLTFTTFHVEFHSRCDFDYVAVYDNTTTPAGGRLIGKFCGDAVPPLLTSTENVMTIVFHSDASLSTDGFTASYRIINASTNCGGNFFTNMGVIRSPNYPQPYPNSRTCVWVIRVDYGNKIALNKEVFVLEGDTLGYVKHCAFDYLEIRDGGYETSPLIGRYCGTKIPKRIVSQSNLLYLKFKSDTTFPNPGFLITWDGTLTGCGGSLTAVTGSIISPNYPEPYGANSLCNYKISVAMGSKVKLNFMDLELENSGSCDSDFIEIIDGFDRTGKSLGKFCNPNNYPASITSSRNQVSIKFRSDVRASGRGFFIKYNTDCNTNVTGFRGVIESPNFPDKFPPGINCTWVIIASAGNKINISFSDFTFLNTCDADYIEIQEGNFEPTNTIGKFCRGKKPPVIASSLERVYIKFRSSFKSSRGSFRAEWILNGCGGTYVKNTGEFKSPNYPNIYPPNTVCEYYISVDPTKSITLTIEDMNFETLKDCFGDYLEVYGGSDNSAPLLTKLCHKTSKPILIETSGNEMYVKFSSDTVTGGRGFSAKYFTKPSSCGGQWTSNSGTITSRNYPKNYNEMDSCLWTINVEPNHKVRLYFEEFDLASDANCTDTYIEVFDGPTRAFPSLLKHCGNTIPSPNPLHSSSNSLTIQMRTGTGFTAKGFKALYELDCGAVITAYESGVISPSDYLLTRSNTDNCSWTISSPQPDGHITLTVSFMGRGTNLCTSNTLFVYDGRDNNATLLGAYCGQKTHLPVVSKGNTLFLELDQNPYSDFNFWATYSSASSACGGILSGETGSFATPGYPASYPANAECVWSLQSAPGNKVELNFKEFDLEESDHCNEEYVEIRQKDATGKLLGVFCGQSLPSNLTAETVTWIKFKSGKTGTGRKGFLADYNLVYNNELSGKFGEIGNPFYPQPYSHHVRDMTWRITVEFGNVITITFQKIYDGYDKTAPVLLQVCGLNKPDAVTSSSNVIYIVFYHSQLHHGSTFLLDWMAVSKPGTSITVASPRDSKCRTTIDLSHSTNNSVIITNPDWPDPYVGNLDCEWILECPDYDHITLNIDVLMVPQNSYTREKCSDRYLGITSKVDNKWKETKKYCLSNETNTRIDTSNIMKISYIAYYSDRSLFSVTAERVCGNSIKKTNGVIKVHWGNYSTKTWWMEEFCHWDITVSPGKKIKVTFTEFGFSSSGNTCTDKYVMLRNGGSEESPLLGKGIYCSYPTMIPLTTSNRLYIKSTTPFYDINRLLSGAYTMGDTNFVLKFEEVSPNCGARIKLDQNFNTTIISTPNYPNIPPAKIECVWTFAVSGEHRLQIDFLERFDLRVSLGCDIEYVEIRDGGTLFSEVLGRYCRNKPSTIKSTGNMLFVKYYTNDTNPKNGFKAQVSIAKCGGTIRGTSGVLTSPEYPQDYLYNTECQWKIETSPKFKVEVSFEDLGLPDSLPIAAGKKKFPTSWKNWIPENTTQTNCSSTASISLEEEIPQEVMIPVYIPVVDTLYNHMQLPMKRTMKNVPNLLGYICNNDPVAPVRASGNKMIIKFQSGSPSGNNRNSPSVRGFKLNFTSVGKGCSYRLDTPSGVVTSPDYPKQSPFYYSCAWKITVPEGRRVTLTVEDLDLVDNVKLQRVWLFNDHKYRSRIALLTGASNSETIYKSSSNIMLVNYWAKPVSGTGKRGFKFTYDSDEPQICGGVLSENKGFIASPSNLSSFFCEWEFQPMWAENHTLALYVNDAQIGNSTSICSIDNPGVLTFSARGRSNYFQYELCGNVTSQIVRSPLAEMLVTAIEDLRSGSVAFNISYKILPCGGVINDFETTITSPSFPNNYPPETDCAWLITSPGNTIKLTFEEFSLEPSCDDYLLVKNGASLTAPLIGRFCGTSATEIRPILSEGSSLFVEFHSDSTKQGKGFKLNIEPGNYVCGGSIHSLGYELMSPNFPSEYNNNDECEWEITSPEGTHIGLVFVDRFHVESSENCQNDFVKVFDYVQGEWRLIKTLCGRELPSPINSTSTRLKVLFRSNGAIVSDGFKAKWYQNCGGIFTTNSGVIYSPGYPRTYKGNFNCTYIIDHKNDKTLLNFTSFNVGHSVDGICNGDMVKISEDAWGKWDHPYDLVGIFCGSTRPGSRVLKGRIKIELISVTYGFNTNYGGFAITFKGSKCGSYVNKTSTIGFYTEPQRDFMQHDVCEWNIVAPVNKIVALRFDDVRIVYNSDCIYPNVQVFDERKNGSFSLGRLCGLLKPRQVVIRSTTNKMTVKYFKSYATGDGFTATVYFTYGPSVGCGGDILLDEKPQTIKSPDINGDGFYEEFLDCTWIIRAKPFHQIVATFKTFDIQTCKKVSQVNSTDSCLCDFLRIKDGTNHYSEVLLENCGTVLPDSIMSSGSVMSVRFSSDGTYNARGFNMELTSVLSSCGVEILTVNEGIQSLTSPNYPQNYPEGLRCKWTIHDPMENSHQQSLIHLHIVEWDIVDSDGCTNDYITIEDTGFFRPLYQSPDYNLSLNKTSDAVEIIRGNRVSMYFSEGLHPRGKITLCGKGKSIDYYSEGNEVTIGFTSNSGSAKKGFKIDYTIAGCTRNYTQENGHIKNHNFKNNTHCYITIVAPSANHTISMYFSNFYLISSRNGKCSAEKGSSYLEVRDGPNVNSPLIEKYCGNARPNPIFSSGQYLWLHIYTKAFATDYQNLDVTYTTTDQGKGCGGRFFGTDGTFSSPGYPFNTRKNSLCRWDITIPSGLEEIFSFSAFDIGPPNTCNTDYIEFYEILAGTETLLSRFCGKDTPALIRSTADVIVVKYTTSFHNGGTGWLLEFKAVTPGAQIL